MTKTITRDDVAAELTKLAEENPDKKAECWYSVEAYEENEKRGDLMQNPGPTALCIAGNLIQRLTPEVYLLLIEGATVTRHENWTLLRQAGYSGEAINLMGSAQVYQDLGDEWDKAVERALK